MLSIDEAWNKYGFRNGCKSKFALISRIRKYVSARSVHQVSDQIGCLELVNCVFWDNLEFVTPEEHGAVIPKNIVKFKCFDFDPPFESPQLWALPDFDPLRHSDSESVTRSSVKRRDGQAVFKAMVANAYDGKCCLTKSAG